LNFSIFYLFNQLQYAPNINNTFERVYVLKRRK
jgi:hypothetical protein